MIREGKKLPDDVLTKIPTLVEKIAEEKDLIVLYAFGSFAEGRLKPLSDLDFAILLSESLDRKERFSRHLDLIGIFNSELQTDEVDLVVLNDAPIRFAHNIIGTGKLLFCRDHNQLADFTEKTIKQYLDFKPVRDRFDREFLKGIGYHG